MQLHSNKHFPRNGKRKPGTNKLNQQITDNKKFLEIVAEVVATCCWEGCVPTEDQSDDESTVVDDIVPENGVQKNLTYMYKK